MAVVAAGCSSHRGRITSKHDQCVAEGVAGIDYLVSHGDTSNSFVTFLEAMHLPTGDPYESVITNGIAGYEEGGRSVGAARAAVATSCATFGDGVLSPSGLAMLKTFASTADKAELAKIPLGSAGSGSAAAQSKTAAPQRGPEGRAFRFTDRSTGGSFDLIVGKPYALLGAKGLADQVLGVPITIAHVSGLPHLGDLETTSSRDMHPARWSDEGLLDNEGTAKMVKAACDGTELLGTALEDVDGDNMDGTLNPVIHPVMGCVFFLLDVGEKPATISLYADSFVDDKTPPSITWSRSPKPSQSPTPDGMRLLGPWAVCDQRSLAFASRADRRCRYRSCTLIATNGPANRTISIPSSSSILSHGSSSLIAAARR